MKPLLKFQSVLSFIFYLILTVAAIQTVNFIGVLIHGLDFLNWWPLQRSRLLSLGGIPDSILSAHTSGLSIDIFIPGLDSILKTHWLTRTGLSLITVYLFLAILATFKRMLHTVSVQQPFDFKNIRRVQIIILLVLIEMVGLDYWRTESMKPLKQLIESMPQPIVGTDSSYQNADAYGYILLLLLFTLLSIFRRGLILYQEQRVIEERLFHKKKLEALGTLANGVGHDFNNILTSIVGYAEIAKSESEPEKVRFAIERLLDSANRAKGLTQQIRIIGGKGAHREHEEIVDLSKELDELLMSIEPTIPDTIAIKKVFDCKKQFAVKLDPTKLYQVLLNLTTNAIQAMENTGGKMTFLIDDESVEDCKGYCLSIEDTGCGMTKDVQVNIFEPYFTTRNHSGGTGLGLALSRSIIEGYGGRLLVESEKGRGSIFSVWLPAYSEKETR